MLRLPGVEAFVRDVWKARKAATEAGRAGDHRARQVAEEDGWRAAERLRDYLSWFLWNELAAARRLGGEPRLSLAARRFYGRVAATADAGGAGLPPDLRACRCGLIFRPGRRDQRWCSSACRKVEPVDLRPYRKPVLLRRDPDTGRVELMGDCPGCGRPTWVRPGQRAHCGQTCRKRAERRRERAR